MTSRHTFALGALLAAAGVGLGAFGAHGLEDRLLQLGYEVELQQRLDWFETGVKYHLYHALAIVVISNTATSRVAPFSFLLGIALFSGSLYAMTFLSSDWKMLGAIVPLGGLSFIVGWILVAVAAWRAQSSTSS